MKYGRVNSSINYLKCYRSVKPFISVAELAQADLVGGGVVEVANDDEVALLHAVAQNGYATTTTLLLDDWAEVKVANNFTCTHQRLAGQNGFEE